MIALGGLAGLGACIAGFMPFLTQLFEAFSTEEELAVYEQYRWLTFAMAGVLFGLAAMQIAAGVGLLRRRRWSVPTTVSWSVLKLIAVVVNTVLTFLVQRDQLEVTIAQDDTGAMGSMEPFVVMMLVGTVVFTLIWGWALPVFNLIWFSRDKIRQDVTTWS